MGDPAACCEAQMRSPAAVAPFAGPLASSRGRASFALGRAQGASARWAHGSGVRAGFDGSRFAT